MATLTKSTGTVALTGAAEKVTLPASYGWVWVKNMSEGDIFAGLSENISEGADGVMVIPSGECGRIQADGFRSVYLLGTGNALVVAQNYADCPFKAAAKGGGSGGSGGGMELIGSYALTYSGTATSGAAWSDEIELPINLYENNRTLLIGIKKDSESTTTYFSYQNYSVMKINVPTDIYDTGKTQYINSSYFWLNSSSSSSSSCIQILYYPETNKLSIRLNSAPSTINGILMEIYDMGVIE